jgi:hypothetical protein
VGAQAVHRPLRRARAARRSCAARRPPPIPVATTLFAIAGFVLGLTFTVRGGGAIDVAYHALMPPLILLTLIVLLRRREGPLMTGETTSACLCL